MRSDDHRATRSARIRRRWSSRDSAGLERVPSSRCPESPTNRTAQLPLDDHQVKSAGPRSVQAHRHHRLAGRCGRTTRAGIDPRPLQTEACPPAKVRTTRARSMTGRHRPCRRSPSAPLTNGNARDGTSARRSGSREPRASNRQLRLAALNTDRWSQWRSRALRLVVDPKNWRKRPSDSACCFAPNRETVVRQAGIAATGVQSRRFRDSVS